MRYEFEGELWEYAGDAAWHFVTLPHDIADEIEEEAQKGGFGSVRVTVTVGGSTWSTSLFPDRKAGSYLLPVKRAVREAEGISGGDAILVGLDLVDL